MDRAQLLASALPPADFNYELGCIQRSEGRLDAALESFAKAIALKVARPEEAHLNRAVIYADGLRDSVSAERELNAALACNPGYLPALLNLGNLHEDRGQRQQAADCYERILASNPDQPIALARLAGLTRPDGLSNPLLQRMASAIADGATSPADRATLGFALGRWLDAGGDYPNAFRTYSRANRDSRAAAGEVAAYDGTVQQRLTDAIIAAFPPGHRQLEADPRSPPPVFICGMFRSGSTLSEQILAAHPDVTAGGELNLLPALVRARFAPFPQSLATASTELLREAARDYLAQVGRLFPGARLITDKRPDNFFYVGLIKTLFPQARIVHSLRNALDNCLSVYFLHLDQRMSYALDLADIGHYYLQYRRLMAHWKALYGESMLELDYDALVREPEPEVRQLLAFCGLGFDPACLRPELTRTAVRTASVWQVREPIHAESSGRWRHYRQQLAPLIDILRSGGVELPD
ncbi:MAG: sulfotransferase [Steroidobacteraceae bacterium]